MPAQSAVAIRVVDWGEARPLVTPLRTAVFVVEQHVPIELELDESDALSRHAIATDAAGRVIGTGRLLPDGHIGRMAVAMEARGRGVGSQLLRRLMDEATSCGFRHAHLSAQLSAQGFYARHGFEAHGPVYMDAGIEHIAMSRKLG
jgi:predicted GNAT family N-acyltransferase